LSARGRLGDQQAGDYPPSWIGSGVRVSASFKFYPEERDMSRVYVMKAVAIACLSFAGVAYRLHVPSSLVYVRINHI